MRSFGDIAMFEAIRSASSPGDGIPCKKAFHSSGMSSRSSITRCASMTTRRQAASSEGVRALGLGERMDLDAECGLPGDGAGHDGAGESDDEGLLAVAAGVDDAHHAHDRPDFVQLLEARVLGLRIALGDDEHVAVLARLFESGEGAGPTDRQRHRDPGKDDYVPHRQHRQDRRDFERLGPGDLDGQGGDRCLTGLRA